MPVDVKKLIQKKKREKYFVIFIQIFIVGLFLFLWEYLTSKKILNAFIFSSPSRIFNTIKNLYLSEELFSHLFTTLNEIIIAFTIGISLGFIVSIILYEIPLLYKIIDPFLTMLNSLPKVALGPMIIIWAGANMKSIIIMALLINLIVSILNIYNGFVGIDETKIKLFKTLGASKIQTLEYLVLPASFKSVIASLKINISMTLIGVIMGEFLVSKEGLGYLIIYGTQVFNLDLVMSGIVILIILSFVLYEFISYIEKKLSQNR